MAHRCSRVVGQEELHPWVSGDHGIDPSGIRGNQLSAFLGRELGVVPIRSLSENAGHYGRLSDAREQNDRS